MRLAIVKLGVAVLALVAAVSGSVSARELPSASEIFDRLGFSENDQARALRGELVSHQGTELSSRDLAIVMAYVVNTSVEAFVDEFARGVDYGDDPAVTAFGVLELDSSTAALKEMRLEPRGESAIRTYGRPNRKRVNFSRDEAQALRAISADRRALEQVLRALLLARYRRYRSQGLSGITPYDRKGEAYEPAGDLLRAVDVAAILDEYAPTFQRTLREYPHYKAPGLDEQFLWVNFELDELPTFVLNHRLSLELEDGVHVTAERHFYVSRSHNAVQTYGGLFPVDEGTVVFYSSRIFTDRAAGLASGVKHKLGRRMMVRQYGRILDAYRMRKASSSRNADDTTR